MLQSSCSERKRKAGFFFFKQKEYFAWQREGGGAGRSFFPVLHSALSCLPFSFSLFPEAASLTDDSGSFWGLCLAFVLWHSCTIPCPTAALEGQNRVLLVLSTRTWGAPCSSLQMYATGAPCRLWLLPYQVRHLRSGFLRHIGMPRATLGFPQPPGAP